MNIAVIGVGNRGISLVQLTAQHGHTVAMYDIDSQLLQRAQLRINQEIDRQLTSQHLTLEQVTQIKQAILPAKALEQCTDADLILDCTPDNEELKKALVEKLDRLAPRTTILASTSPTLSITQLALVAKRFPERLVGMYFTEPIQTHTLVQLVKGDQTAKDIIERTAFFIRQLKKSCVTLKDSTGLILDRLMTVYGGEALRILGEGHLEAETLDRLITSLGIKTGPLHLIDAAGVDTYLQTTQTLYEASFQEARYRPHPILRKMLHLNQLGRKTKQGFFSYTDE